MKKLFLTAAFMLTGAYLFGAAGGEEMIVPGDLGASIVSGIQEIMRGSYPHDFSVDDYLWNALKNAQIGNIYAAQSFITLAEHGIQTSAWGKEPKNSLYARVFLNVLRRVREGLHPLAPYVRGTR